MKRLLTLATAISLIASPVMAHPNDDRPRQRDNTPVIIAGGLLGALIVGSMVNNDPYKQQYRYENRPTQCWQERMIDYYGRVYYRTICEQ